MSDLASLPPSEPYTPARDPALIDRNGLIGVGELHTPRWSKSASYSFNVPRREDEGVSSPPVEAPDDRRGTPWTIEAGGRRRGGESQNNAPHAQHFAPGLHARLSIADESGGEEILYPRKPWHMGDATGPFTQDLRPNPAQIRPSPLCPPLLRVLAPSFHRLERHGNELWVKCQLTFRIHYPPHYHEVIRL